MFRDSDDPLAPRSAVCPGGVVCAAGTPATAIGSRSAPPSECELQLQPSELVAQ